ncbi:MAG: SIMPL domain-containing protein [Firmicutes bacterium]|nr:SIMPL domain-containing protein [Bacillota bacterium]
MKKYILTLSILSILILTLGLSINSFSALLVDACDCDMFNTSINHNQHSGIILTGTGAIKIKPDFASINLSIETRNINLEQAQQENTRIVESLIKVLKTQNIDEQDINTNWFNIYPEYDYSFGQRFLGHRVSNQLSIKVRDIFTVGKIIDLSTAAGANIINGVQFGVEDNSKAYNNALIKAVEDAKQKAMVLSKLIGFDNIRIVAIKETNHHFGFTRHDYSAVPHMASAGYTQVLHNDIEVFATVKVVFDIL